MTDRNETLDRLIEAARLLGITQAKKGYGIYTIADGKVEGALYESIDTLSQALTKPEIPMSPEHLPQYIATNNIKPTTEGGGGAGGAKLYTASPTNEWVGLTEADTKNLIDQSDLLDMFENIGWYSAPKKGFEKHSISLIRTIEAKLKEKNHG